ncbi:MAG: arginine--tRNA ligase [Candidatus Krumholzibacteriota bacterium]|nr:arginine--tRNA ligase [Candidatus Krumholzibacteriota bacterium]
MENNRSEKTVISARSRVVDEISRTMTSLGYDIQGTEIYLERPNNPDHGDLSCNLAMVVAKKLGMDPKKLAESIVSELSFEEDFIDKVEVAGHAFINLTFSKAYLKDQVALINRIGSSYGDSEIGRGRKVQVEYVSANPTGPLVIVSARAAAVGTSLAQILRKTGHDVETEYYLNDAGNQVKKLGISLHTRFRQRMGEELEFPDDGYPGEYLVDIAETIDENTGKEWLSLEEDETANAFGGYAVSRITDGIVADLERFGVTFDKYFKESTLFRDGGETGETLEIFREKEVVYEKEGALWFRSTDYGDEKDRVLIRSDGTPTYFLADAAYHLNKFKRGFDHVIDIFGPDHHGHIARLNAAAAVFGAPDNWLDILTVQWVRLIEDGKQIKMSKRGGEFETLSDLVADIGSDASKFFFLMRKTNAHLDFNLTLARTESDENPVYYVQYAHARICSVISYAETEGVSFPDELSCIGKLGEEEEMELIRNLVIFPYLIEGAAISAEPHRLSGYAQQLAASFHRFYHVCRIISNDKDLSQARLLLAEATRIVLAETLHLLGISAPERM